MAGRSDGGNPVWLYFLLGALLVAGIGVFVVLLVRAVRPTITITSRPLSGIICRETYTLNPKTSVTLASMTGAGYANMVFRGDGHPTLYVRVYADGILDSEFPASEARVVVVAYLHSLRIELYNPSDYVVTGSSPRVEVQGMLTPFM